MSQNFDQKCSIGVIDPKGIPPAVIANLEGALEAAVKTDEFSKIAGQLYMKPAFQSSKDFDAESRKVFETDKDLFKDLIQTDKEP